MIVSAPKITVTVAGVGARGQAGAPGISSAQQYVAAVAVSALRVLTLNSAGEAVYAQSDTVAIVGVSIDSAAIGALVTVAGTDHALEDSSWTWTIDGALFVATDGVLTQNAPTSGLWMPIGVAISATRIVVKQQTAVTL